MSKTTFALIVAAFSLGIAAGHSIQGRLHDEAADERLIVAEQKLRDAEARADNLQRMIDIARKSGKPLPPFPVPRPVALPKSSPVPF